MCVAFRYLALAHQPVGLEIGLPLTSVATYYLRITGCAKHGNEERKGRVTIVIKSLPSWRKFMVLLGDKRFTWVRTNSFSTSSGQKQ